MRHVSTLLTLALVCGIAGGVCLDVPLTLGLSLIASAAWVVGVLAVRLRHVPGMLGAAGILLACGGWILGSHAVDRALHSPLRTLLEQQFGGFGFDAYARRLDEPLTVEGRLIEDAQLTTSGAVIRVAVRRVLFNEVSADASGGISLGVNGAVTADLIEEWRAGRVVRVPALLRRPARYLNAGLSDQERALARRGISLVGTVKSAALLEIVERGRWWDEAAAAARARTRRGLRRHMIGRNEHALGIATAILIGDRAGLSDATERRLQEAGTYHVIAISGGNIAILATLVVGLLATLGIRGRTGALFVIAALIAYGLIAAGGVSVARATVMAVIYFAVRLIDQRTPPANAVSLSASAMLVVKPLQVVDVGFWFTFGATVALLTATTFAPVRQVEARPRSVARRRLGGLRHATTLILVGSACVELAVAPVNAFVFQRVTLAGLVLNFAALPAMSVVQLSAMSLVAADVLGLNQIATLAAFGVDVGARVLVEGSHLLDYAPWLTWRVPSPAPAVMVLFYLSLAAAVLQNRFAPLGVGLLAKALAVSAALLFAWIITAPQARTRALGDGLLHVSMLDVGQGDCLLTIFPNGRTLLIDTGGLASSTFDIAERVVGPTLRARQLLRLDYLAVTHADADHVGGAAALVRDFTPREIWWGIPVANHEPTEAVRQAARVARAGWRTLQRGDALAIDDVEVRLHHPPPPDWERQRIRNNDSLVIEVRWRQVSLLFTGDVGREVESELVSAGPVVPAGAGLSSGILALAPTVMLKVAHHGSLSSSTPAFLGAIKPSIALISAGRGNTYGHPAPLVLGRLQDANAEIFRTDIDGQIDVSTDGTAVWVTTWTGRRHTHEGHDGHEAHEGQKRRTQEGR